LHLISIFHQSSPGHTVKMRFLNLTAQLSLFTLASTRFTPYATTCANDTSFPSLSEATLDELVAGLESKHFTSADLVKAYSARILEVNSTLHVVTELNPDALSIACHADELRKNGTILGPLHGIPILIKNNIATDDAMNNTAGSFALLGAKQGESTIAAKLRKAGAVILGKTNLSQWANFRSDNSTNGWSAYGGQTEGVYYPQQDPSGSSSGSGVSSALGLAWASLGTETSGSILSPADVSNLVGIKPSVGLTSRHLVIPISEHQDTVGPMARTVKDAAYLLQAIAGPDPSDNYTSAIPNNGSIPDYVSACKPDALQGVRIGVARNVLDIYSAYLDAPVLQAFDQAVSQIESLGATIVEANFTGFEAYQNDTNSTLVLNADFLVNLKTYFDSLTYNPKNITDLAQLTSFTHAFPAEAYPNRDTGVWDGPNGALTQGWNNTDPRFWQAYQANLYYGGEGGVLGALKRSNTSAILLPTQVSPGIPALVGSPVITVPMGFYPADWNVTRNSRGSLVESGPGVPFGLSFMGDLWAERELVGFAFAYEGVSGHRAEGKPYLVPGVELGDVV
jgi:amidase